MDPAGHARVERRLAAILAADVAGYSRLMGADEEGTVRRLKSMRAGLIDPTIDEHNGRIVHTAGDGLLVEFHSVVDAMRCAIEWQGRMTQRNAGDRPDARIDWRIGVNLGDIIIADDDIHGDGINIAARLEAMAEPGGICISHAVLTQTRGKLDFPVEDLGDQALKNIAQPVHVLRVGAQASRPPVEPVSPMAEPAALPLPDKPSIAVLPFQNMSGDPEQEYFTDGMVEDIITALSRIRWLFVIARNSSFIYKRQALDVKQVGRELGVRYVLEGSVRRAGNRVRITAQLIEAFSGASLWADRFDGPLEDVFELQDKVAISVAGVIEPTLQAAEIRRSAERPTNDLTAYDLYLRALSLSWEKDAVVRSLDLLERAIERDPHYGSALAQPAARHHDLHVNGWTHQPEANRDRAIHLAQQAVGVASCDPEVLATSAHVLGYYGEDIRAAIALVDRALELNPGFARGWQKSGWLRLWTGHPDLAIDHFETALRLDPREQRANPFMGIGVAHFFARRFEEAKVTLLQSLLEKPSWAPTYRFLASCYAHMGRLDDARVAVTRLRTLTGVVVPSATHWNPEYREFYLSGLRQAAGEET